MAETTELVPELLEAGVHFGHQTKRWNPKMKPFIFEQRNQIYIINLDETVRQLRRATDFLQEVARRGGRILFVGCKKQAQEAIKEAALACGQFYVNQRWLGGTLTNLATIRKSIGRLKYIEQIEQSPEYKKMGKQELAALNREAAKLRRNLEGIIDMSELPDALVVIDRIAIAAAFSYIRDEMLGGGDDACPLEGADERARHLRREVGIFAVGLFYSSPAHVVRDVDDWREDLANASGTSLAGDGLAGAGHEIAIPSRRERYGGGKHRRAIALKPVDGLVERDDRNAKPRFLDEVALDGIDALGRWIRDLKAEDALRVVGRRIVEIARDHEELPELLFERHARQEIAHALVDLQQRILVRRCLRRRERHRA